MNHEQSGWQSHRGGSCPVAPDTKVQVRYRNGVVSDTIPASQRRWEAWRDLGDTDWDIVQWRSANG
jgi:hypothetical protein